MKGEDKQLIRFFEGADKRFIIPLYQRNYDWQILHCRQLFSDLVKTHEEGRKSHFFGSIVTSRANDVNDDFLVIDGQQRITTISLLFIAMVNAAKSGDLRYDDVRQIDKILKTYLVDEYQDDDHKVKLKPIKNDREAFEALLYKTSDKYVKESNVTRNYLLFYNLLKGCQLTLEEMLASIRKLIIIDIRLERDDDPQLIFESLNSTGLDLSEADKIRNYLLMSMDAKEQERCYKDYWNVIEECTDYEPTMFIRDYLTIQTRSISKIGNLYPDFKSYVLNKHLTREAVLSDMAELAQYYAKFIHCNSGDKRLNKKFRQLNTLDSTVGIPFFTVFLKYAHDNNLSAREQYEVFDIVEGYWARRIICRLPSNALNKVFAAIHHEIIRLMVKEAGRGLPISRYAEVLKFVLLKRQGSGLYPSDGLLQEEFKTREIYRLSVANRYFLFERMENGGSKEGTWDMPQTLSTTWRQHLGPEAERIHDQYLHTFANLTLTAYNSNYGNRPFSEKKSGYEYKGEHIPGIDESHFTLSDYVKSADQWTEKELLERQQLLYNKFLSLWPMPTTTFKPLETETDIVSFDDDETELTGRKILSFTYKGEKHEVSSWKDMLVGLCGLLYQESPSSMRVLCNANEWAHDEIWVQEKGHKGCTEFEKGCYINSSNSTQTKVIIIHFLFNKLNVSYADLEFNLAPISESDANREVEAELSRRLMAAIVKKAYGKLWEQKA